MSDESGESEIRKRAAWLLVMLALVAVLFAFLIFKVFGGKTSPPPPAALHNPITSLSVAPPTVTPTHKSHPSAENGSPEGSSGPPSPAAGTQTTATGPVPHSCPTSAPCILDGDVGNAIAAVNAYRAAHGADPVPGTVTPAAQNCAVSNGSKCSGGWAETYQADANGASAVAKLVSHAHDLTTMKAFEIGWAYSPSTHLYYIAIVQDS